MGNIMCQVIMDMKKTYRRETVVEISVSVCSTVGCNQQVCTVKIRSIDRSKLDLYRPLAELAYRSRSIISRGS